MHLAAGALDLGGPAFQVEIEIGERVVLDVAADPAELLELGSWAIAAARRDGNAGRVNTSAFCRRLSASAWVAFSLKAGLVERILGLRGESPL